MKLYILLFFIFNLSTSYAAGEYQQKVCKEIPYLLTVKKASIQFRQKLLMLINNKYKGHYNEQLKQKKSLEVEKSIDMSVCNDVDTKHEVTLFMNDRVQYIAKFGKLCLKSNNDNVPAKIKTEFNLTDDRDNFLTHSWSQYYNIVVRKICLNSSSGKDCNEQSAPTFNYISMKELKVENTLCEALVKEVNIFLDWKNSIK